MKQPHGRPGQGSSPCHEPLGEMTVFVRVVQRNRTTECVPESTYVCITYIYTERERLSCGGLVGLKSERVNW